LRKYVNVCASAARCFEPRIARRCHIH
jgi:hypothetical protein